MCIIPRRNGKHVKDGTRISGPIGDVADVFTLVSTFFGIATSLGLGVVQLNAGLDVCRQKENRRIKNGPPTTLARGSIFWLNKIQRKTVEWG